MAQSRYQDGGPDINNYWDSSTPPPQRLSGTDSYHQSNYASGDNLASYAPPANPFLTPTGPSNTTRGHYFAPEAAFKTFKACNTIGIQTSTAQATPLGAPARGSRSNSVTTSAPKVWREQVRSHRTSSDGSMVAIPGTAGVVLADPNDPSKFEKDSRLKNSFYGFAYTPLGALLPECGATQANVTEDIQLLSQLTTRIRLYGSDCNQTALVLQAIKDTKVDLEVFVGIYLADVNEDDAAYTRQRDLIKDAITTYGTDHIAGVSVGNEYILNSVTAAKETTATGTAGLAAAAKLVEKIKDTRQMLAGMSLSKNLPVGTSDAGSYFNTPLLEAIDYGLANVHPWFAHTTINDAAGWTWDFFQQNNIAQANAVANKPTMYIAETGWPTQSSSVAAQNNGAADASVKNLQVFMDTFVCASNTNQTNYFFFEFKDEPWKDALYGGVEGWWGVFDADKKLKDVTIPDCAHH
ncbi:glycosyl hydrolase 17 family [Rhizoctonia solani]|uniref:glucan endo-1,3-beta-D-glucosidase n=1 Tax=Rhizoctonia solani TaxID=456999 RepID=A0A8H7IDF5_9AGAM|nr:glycosyl hydrolase 17 family [Rhizoctonia solani]